MLWLELLQLKSKDAETRLQAVQRLARAKGASVFRALGEAAQDSEAAVRCAALAAVAKRDEEGGTDVLLEALQDAFPEVRQVAVDGLKDKTEDRVRLRLVDALQDPDPGVRGRAGRVLTHQQWRPPGPKQELWFAVARGQLDQAAAFGAQAIEPLELVLNGGPFNLQVSAVRALGKIADERVLKSLIPSLESTDNSVCVAAIEALANFGGPKATAALTPMLKHTDHRVRVAGIEALGQLEAQNITSALVELVADPMWDVRRAAADALGKIHDPEAVEGLARALQDADNDVREAAVTSLARLRDPRAIGPLVIALADVEPGVRRAALSALPLINPDWAKTEAARAVAPELRRLWEGGEAAVRYAAVNALGQMGESPTKISSFDTGTVITAAAQKQNRVLTVFTELLRDADGDLRLAAAGVLGRLGDKRAVEALRPVLTDADDTVRRATVQALLALGAE